MYRVTKVVSALIIITGIVLMWTDPFKWLRGLSPRYLFVSWAACLDLFQSAFTGWSPFLWIAGKLGASPADPSSAMRERAARGTYGMLSFLATLFLYKSGFQVFMLLPPLVLLITGITGLCPVMWAYDLFSRKRP